MGDNRAWHLGAVSETDFQSDALLFQCNWFALWAPVDFIVGALYSDEFIYSLLYKDRRLPGYRALAVSST